jgi:hypothetical protein
VDTKKAYYTTKVKPYDDSMWDQCKMYDSIPYVWDRDLYDTRHLSIESGNIIKSYRCLIKEPYEVKH